MDATAFNYNADANTDDGSCIQAITQENIHSAVDLWFSDQTLAEATYGHISNWDVSDVYDMNYLFSRLWNEDDSVPLFNSDISNWDVANVTNMDRMFAHQEEFNQDLSQWDVSNVTNMSHMFTNCSSFTGIGLENWNVSSVANFWAMFQSTNITDVDLSNWDVSGASKLASMFIRTSFNSDISNWDVSNVTDMGCMFCYDSEFNQEIGGWDVSNVTNMGNMFEGNSNFNADLSSWDVSSVTNLTGVFRTSGFNRDISNWNINPVANLQYMFWGNSSFNQDISSWDVSEVTNMNEMFENANGLSDENKCLINMSFSSSDSWPYDWSDLCSINGCMDSTAFNYNPGANTQTSPSIGDVYQGGYLFYIDETGENGLVAAMEDIGEYNSGCFNTEMPGLVGWGPGMDIGSGYQNTLDIVAGCSETLIAASVTLDYDTLGYDDWYLPSIYELQEMYNAIGDIGGFDGEYWSSSDLQADIVRVFNFDTGEQGNNYNSNHQYKNVRAIRLATIGCVEVLEGCTEATAFNYNADANTDDGSCVAVVNGCTDVAAFNYNSEANTDDGSCVAVVNGCTDAAAFNYNAAANTNDGSCISWEEFANDLQDQLATAMANQEDGVSQADVDAAYAEGAASVTPEDGVSQADVDAAYVEGAASVTPEDGIGQADVDAAYDEGVASVEVPECEEVDTQNIPLELLQGWNMIGYTCIESKDVVSAFSEIADKIEIVKDAWGLAYLPAWGFSAFDNLEYGKGYQIKMNEEVTDFQFCSTVVLASDDNEPQISIGYGTYSILSWTNDGEEGLPSESSAYMNINSDAILTIDVVESFPNEQGQFVDIYNSLPANYESDFTDTIYITPFGEEAFSLLISSNENSIYLSGTDNYGSNILIEITPVTTIHGCMDPNNPSYNSSANKNDNSCLEGCFDTNACNYGEEGATECTYPVNECDCEGNGPDYANASFQINLNDGGFDEINNVELTVNLWEGEQEMIIGLEDNNGDGIWEGNFDGAQGAMFDFVINVYGSEQTTLNDCGGNPFVNGFPNPVADGLDVCNVWNNTIELNPFDCPEPQLQIGDIAHGGIVFQINEDGTGLVAALEDIDNSGFQWDPAVQGALDYESNGFDDWYLPSFEELDLMYYTIGNGGPEGNIGNFQETWYWSSSSSTNHAWRVRFSNGQTFHSSKINKHRVRPVRAF